MLLDPPVLLSKARLDALAAEFHPLFNEGGILAPFDPVTQGARYDVALRRIETVTRIPETGEIAGVTGLLALPVGAGPALPVVSWQHGTIFSFDLVPSNLLKLGDPAYAPTDARDSLETLFNLHRLAGQGFAVIAADYLGKGPRRDGRAEAYAVKGATVQTCLDILTAGHDAMERLGHRPSALFLNGWSQGGLNTQWLAQALQARCVPVRAVAAQSPFNDLASSLRFWGSALRFADPPGAPYPPLPGWIGVCLLIVLGSYRAYYGLDDLFRAAIRPEHRAIAETFWRDYPPDPGFLAQIPPPPELLVPGFFDRFTDDLTSRFLRQMAANSATGWAYAAPVRLYYGLADQALHPGLVTPALAAGGAAMTGVPVAGGSHRATFLASLYGAGPVIAGCSTVPDWFRAAL